MLLGGLGGVSPGSVVGLEVTQRMLAGSPIRSPWPHMPMLGREVGAEVGRSVLRGRGVCAASQPSSPSCPCPS